ncbi:MULTISPECIES: DUF4199 domain-containing protein [unclassified Tenacibaculum]|uniref:DUF4199 domain-containing protein n=1 Tax=unclassified Tenacibaculum TaxID=2635139 RepID=UPI001F39E065|nr:MULTISPECIES: DUF4199 domain-containing protein [unclassified Tenacibaculum]MCF2874525.1 DUF4199 domain-containing protein [Tenacibaculum sp. Cn5-1]MCF2934409.1 DUF4199 domain-containing protein [Tenacibaculum sp. Cn5-34]MCG7510619.1 DUF4199 domain-containing protein [Tenacibaculum sp. Cn5-46]
MKSTILKYGVYGFLTGLIIFTLHLVLGIKNLDYSTNEILGYVSIFISLSFIYFGIKHYRDNVNNGIISLGKAIAIGTLISLMVGVGIGIADFIYTEFINPDFFKSYEDMLIKQGREAEIIEMTSTTAALFMIVLVSIIGFIISLLSALFLQRK